MADASIFNDWQAKSVAELRQIWADLRPDTNEAVDRAFRDQVLTPDQAGDVFERWVLEAFRLSGATGHYGFEVPMSGTANTREQIDGLVFDGWQGFLVECKFWRDKVDFGPIALFHAQLDRRPVGTIGLFFSAFGYTAPAGDSADLLHPMRVLRFDRLDLGWALAHKTFKGRMLAMVRRKWMLAVKNGPARVQLTDTIEVFNE